MVAVPVRPFDAATCAAVLPLPYFFDESDFEDAWMVAAAVPPEPPEAVHVLAFWYVQVVSFFVSFAGFMPGVVDDVFVLWLDAPACTCVEFELWVELVVWAVVACFSCPGAVAELPCPGSARAAALQAAAATAQAHAAAKRAKGRLICVSPISR